MSNLSSTQETRKFVVRSRYGVVAAQHKIAAEVGAEVLRAGGSAVDAAVAVSFALGVVEPWMSGSGGGGSMIVRRAGEMPVTAIDFGLYAPAALKLEDFRLLSGAQQTDMFGWRGVEGDINVRGAKSIATPGLVAGMDKAHRTYGVLPWAELLRPATELARQGTLVDWYSSLMIASAARSLAADPHAASIFLDDGRWPVTGSWTGISTRRLDQGNMGAMLDQLARAGAQDFYRGDIAQSLARDIQNKGGYLSVDDLLRYETRIGPALLIPYGGTSIYTSPGLTAGPTLATCLKLLDGKIARDGRAPGANDYLQYASTVLRAQQERFEKMGDLDAASAPSCTTHFSIVDKNGNMCSVTQTLLSLFGSCVVSPSTGMALNNGIMWFDPEPGKPNSIGPGKACLMNICPTIGTGDGHAFAVGSAGGRKILGTVAQLISFLVDKKMTLEEAFHTPRIDMSTGAIIADDKLPDTTLSALSKAFKTEVAPRTAFPYAFGCPAAISRRDALNDGITEIMSPWGDAVAEDTAARG